MKHKLRAAPLVMLLAACSLGPVKNEARYSVPLPPATVFESPAYALAGQTRLDDERPNIILVLTDDQPYHTIEYMPTVRTVMMGEGITFTHGYVTTPLCCPSRSSILTGQYAHNHEVYTNVFPAGGAPKFKDQSTFAVWLHDAGYRTAYYGKYMNDYESLTPAGYVPPGWDEWGVFFGKNLPSSEEAGAAQYYLRFSLSENGQFVEYRSKANYSADVLTAKAVEFIAESRNQPFLLVVGYYNPHSPFLYADRHNEAFRRLNQFTPWRPLNLNESNIRDKPAYLQQLLPFSLSELDTTYARILRSLLSVDDGVASILNALEKTGLRQKTVVVYLSDNGLTVGEHRFGFSKNCPYEACIRTPYIVYAPGQFAARQETQLVANIDLAPTFAELAGVEIPSDVDGVSLMPLLEQAGANWRQDLLIEHWPTEEGIGSLIPAFSAILTQHWKYVVYSTGERELYNLVLDAGELRNLAGDSRYGKLMAQLAARLRQLEQK
ncbi:MAG TPA: sulfatase [Anaerolineae bacterium]|nr:sulfatase [Anaerolineae bacterium]